MINNIQSVLVIMINIPTLRLYFWWGTWCILSLVDQTKLDSPRDKETRLNDYLPMSSSVEDIRHQWKNSSESKIKLKRGLVEEQIGSQHQDQITVGLKTQLSRTLLMVQYQERLDTFTLCFQIQKEQSYLIAKVKGRTFSVKLMT